jgi:hypothetical protein
LVRCTAELLLDLLALQLLLALVGATNALEQRFTPSSLSSLSMTLNASAV